MGIFKIFKKIFNKDDGSTDDPLIPDVNTYVLHENSNIDESDDDDSDDEDSLAEDSVEDDSVDVLEFVPKENYTRVNRSEHEIDLQQQASKDDKGWSSCYEYSGENFTVRSKDIPIEEISGFFTSNGFTEYVRVVSTDGNKTMTRDDVKAFRKASIRICAEHDGKCLCDLWINERPHAGDNATFKQVLLNFSAKWKFLLDDSKNSLLVDISSGQEIDEYFSCLEGIVFKATSMSYATRLDAIKQHYPFAKWQSNNDTGMEQYTEENCNKAKTIFDNLIDSLANLGEDATAESKVALFKTAVSSLNDLNNEVEDLIETGEREDLCELIDEITIAAELDPGNYGDGEGLASEWREW